ncbi:MAG: hypothetical protein ACM3SW_00790, partial [Actinomycetota bacterium]
MLKSLFLTVVLTFVAPVFMLHAQTAPAHSTSKPAQNASGTTTDARPGDVDTPEHIVAALYDVISGPAG